MSEANCDVSVSALEKSNVESWLPDQAIAPKPAATITNRLSAQTKRPAAN